MFVGNEYQPDYNRVAIDDFKFKSSFKATIIKSMDHLEKVLDPIQGQRVGFDTETTGLSFYKDKIVGFSFSVDHYEGYYVPIRHLCGENIVGKNDDTKPIFDLLYDKLLLRNNIFLYNAAFDLIMLEAEGYNPMKIKTFDVQILVYLLDTNYKSNGLKNAQKLILGRDVPDFSEIVGSNYTFDMLVPEDGTYYAACDAAGTLALYDYLYPKIKKECPFIVNLDNRLAKCMVYYLQNPIYIDSAKMRLLKVEVEQKIKLIDREIYKTIGYPFDIQSNPQTALALRSLNIDTGETTPTGQMSLREETLTKLGLPICDLIVQRRSLLKQLTSYIIKFTEVDMGHVNYQINNVPTGRLSSGNSGKGKKQNSFFLPLNFQNLTKAKSQMYEVRKSKEKENILGYNFTPIEKEYIEKNPEKRFVEAHKQELNIRNAVTVPDKEDWYFVSIDYCLDPNTTAELENGDVCKLKNCINKKVKTPFGYHKLYNFRYTGGKEAFKLILNSGRSTISSKDHQFLVRSFEGKVLWKKLEDIKKNDYVFEEV